MGHRPSTALWGIPMSLISTTTNNTATAQSSRSDIRRLIRDTRKKLSSEFQSQSGKQLVERCTQLPEIHASQKIALYLSADGELDTAPLISWLWQQGKSVYLPVIHPFSKGHLLFLKYDEHTPLVNNRYNIAEPKLDAQQVAPVANLDLIFTPLVAFDHSGQRLGMGGGYYDRTLASWFSSGKGAKPIGLAHDCQQVETLPTEAWDIPLPKIVTPTTVWAWD